MKIGSRDSSRDVLLVAEIGNNHEGSLELALELIGTAFQCGADAVKLQTFVPELYVSRRETDRLAALRRFALPFEDVLEIMSAERSAGREVFTTPFDLESVARLEPQDLFKVSSGDLTYDALLAACAQSAHRLIVSTGGSRLDEVFEAVRVVENAWEQLGRRGDLALLHCVSAYPAPATSANLGAIGTLKRAFPGLTIGYSDHVIGIDVATLAAASGARIVEKHFTLDRHLSDFRDHALSSTPAELSELRERLDFVTSVLGDGAKEPQDVELALLPIIRRSIHALRDLPAGIPLRDGDFALVRPTGGLSPGESRHLLGRSLCRPLSSGDPIVLGDLI